MTLTRPAPTATGTGSRPANNARLGILLALLSAAAFGGSGSLAKSLLDLGWSPAALVAVRLGGAALVLALPAVLAARRWRPSRRGVLRLVLYGVIATGGAQFCYFSAVQYLPVGTAILLEFSAPIWLIGIYWLRDRRRPAASTLAAAGLAVVGLILVLDVLHSGRVDLRGLAWGLGAAACLCGYFLLADDNVDGAGRPPALLVAAAGTGVGAVVVITLGLFGLMPMHASFGRARLGGVELPWLLPLAALVLIPTVLAYTLGIEAVRRLGGAVASFVGLAEVLFSVLFSALLLGQRPGPAQLAGMVLVVVGIAIVQRSSRSDEEPDVVPAS